jgi:hypothetical protein
MDGSPAIFQLNMQKRNPPMMPGGIGDDEHRRARFTTYLKTLPGPTMNQIGTWNRHKQWKDKDCGGA